MGRLALIIIIINFFFVRRDNRFQSKWHILSATDKLCNFFLIFIKNNPVNEKELMRIKYRVQILYPDFNRSYSTSRHVLLFVTKIFIVTHLFCHLFPKITISKYLKRKTINYSARNPEICIVWIHFCQIKSGST